METFKGLPSKTSEFHFADHEGNIHTVEGSERDTTKYLFKTHILFRDEQELQKLVDSSGVKSAESVGQKIDRHIVDITKMVIKSHWQQIVGGLVILGITGLSGYYGKQYHNKQQEVDKIKNEQVMVKNKCHQLAAKYNVKLGSYRDLRGESCQVYDVKEDLQKGTVWIMSIDGHGLFHADDIESFFDRLEYKYQGKVYNQQANVFVKE